jgi:8-oxo-dGTP pyrophosphatase MutT (NUDIX family)
MSPPEKPDWLKVHGPGWSRRPGRPIYDNSWISLTEFQATAPTGAPAVYGVVGFKNLATGILPIFEDGTIVLVGQHRFPLEDYSWEIPEGGVPLGSDPLEGARRELKEEAGLEAGTWRQVLNFQLSNSVTDERGFGFIATDLTEVPAEPDATESLALERVPFAEALDQAMKGRIWDMITLAMLLRAYHMAREGELSAPLARAMLAEGRRAP